jgi:excisionase family DNA binding protein
MTMATKRTAHKAARMMLLFHLRQAGVLQDLSLEEIGQIAGVNRSTIHRDMQDMEAVEAEYHRLMAEQPWIRRTLTVDEFAERIGASSETIRCLIRDGLIRADKQPERGQGGRWYIPATELDWWLRPK